MMKKFCILAFVCLLASAGVSAANAQQTVAPKLEPFVGWWIGKGRLGFRGGKTENIKCRAVYRKAEEFDGLKQSIRCATNSGTVDIVSQIQLNGDELVGTWKERKYNFTGELKGHAVAGGFRVKVLGTDLSANMTVIARGDRQIVELQFFKGTLLGLSVTLRRGSAQRS